MMKQYSEYKDSGVKWIGNIPSHWEVDKICRLFSSIGSGTTPRGENYYCDKENGIPWINSGDLNYGVLNSVSKYVTKKAINECSALKVYKKGTLLVAMYGASIGKYAISNIEGCTNQACCALCGISKKLNLSYAKYIMSPCKNKWISESFGGTQPNISAEKVKQTWLTLPPLPEQQAIVSYLDAKVAKIDSYIATATKKIAALDELKQVTIANAVTKGINPNAPMKDSGIPWIGMVPENWKRARYKDVFKVIDEKVGERKDLTLLSLTKKGVIVRDLSEGKGKFPKDYESYKVVYPNNLILCLFDVDETPRTVGISNNYGMITGAYDIFTINNAKLEYIYYLYLSIDTKKGFKALYKGLRKVIPLPSLLSAYLHLPPLSEQNEIVTYIDRKVAQIDQMRTAELSQIEKLKEYKQRLISDVVTGKVKVTND